MLRLERARLLASQSEQNEWINFKLSLVPYVYAEGNDKLFAKRVFSNEEAYSFFRETECEPTCYATNEWDQETHTEYWKYTCTKHIDGLNIDIYGLHSNTLCWYFADGNICRNKKPNTIMGAEDAFREAANIVTQSKWTWLYLVHHDHSLSGDFEGITTMADLYNYLTTKVYPSIFERFTWLDTHDEKGLNIAKAMATDICDSRCSLQMASSSGEAHVDNSCVHTLNGVIYPVVYDYQLCPYVKSYVDCSTPKDDGLDGTTIIIIVAVAVVVLLIAILTYVHCCRKHKASHASSESNEDYSSSTSNNKEERI